MSRYLGRREHDIALGRAALPCTLLGGEGRRRSTRGGAHWRAGRRAREPQPQAFLPRVGFEVQSGWWVVWIWRGGVQGLGAYGGGRGECVLVLGAGRWVKRGFRVFVVFQWATGSCVCDVGEPEWRARSGGAPEAPAPWQGTPPTFPLALPCQFKEFRLSPPPPRSSSNVTAVK